MRSKTRSKTYLKPTAMDSQFDNQKRKPLVTVEFQTEVDVATGNREKRMFVKMYFEARDSGLLGALPDELWKTLCCLATYMDENGHCYPSQALLAKSLGISREHINKRIQRLLAFRFNGEPVLTMAKSRESRRGGSRWSNNVYQLRPISGFAMFDQPIELPSRELPLKTGQTSMLPSGHTELRASTAPLCDSLCDSLCDPLGHTNQTEPELTKTLNVNDFKKALLKRQVADTNLSAEKEIRRRSLVIEMLEVCRDKHSRGFYQLIAEKAPEELIRAALSETKYQASMGKIRKSRGAFFTDEIQRITREQGIDLGLNMQAGIEKTTSSH
jgi:hypothetical protein